MGLTWQLGGATRTTVRLDAWNLVEAAYRGQVGAGGFRLDDTTGTYLPPAMKVCSVDESAASPTRMFTGYIAERDAYRGPLRVQDDRQWDVTVEDVNVLLDDRVIVTGGNRPQETDYERIQWLLSDASSANWSAGVVPNTNTVTMDAIDYRGQHPRDVLEDCAQKSGKNFFLYSFGSGIKLYYDLSSGTSLTSSLRISDVATDVDSSTTFGASNIRVTRDPSNIYSRVRVRFKNGRANVRNVTTENNYRVREKQLNYMRVKTLARAQEQAQKWLDTTDTEKVQVTLDVTLPASKVNDIRAGHRLQLKLVHAELPAFTYYRVTQRTVMPQQGGTGFSDVSYTVRLTFQERHKSTKFNNRQNGLEAAGEDKELSNESEDGASVVIDAAGITITNGAISITNENGTVIIDGSTDFWSIKASGTIVVPQNTVRGTLKAQVSINTGLSVNPVTFGTIQRPDTDGNWVQVCPVVISNISGQILEYYAIRARSDTGGNTVVQAIKESTNPPLAQKSFRYFVMQKDAL